MKQKRTYVTLLLIVALLCLGIAYAAFTADTLTINGTATASVADGDVNVVFIKADPAEGSNAGTTAEIDAENDTASFTVAGLTKAGDTQTVTFDVENQTEHGVPVTLQDPTIQWANGTSTHGWYEVTESTISNKNLAAYEADGNADSTTLTVTVKLLKTVSTEASQIEANTNNTVTITLKAEAANN